MARERGEGRLDGNIKDFVVKIRRCAAVVKGGRRFSFNALVVVGDMNGKVSYGYGKANEVPPAVEKALKDGQENLRRTLKISMKGETIPHRVVGRFGASRVILVPAGPGTGGKAGPGGAFYVAYGTRHAISNAGSTPARYFVVAIGGDVK